MPNFCRLTMNLKVSLFNYFKVNGAYKTSTMKTLIESFSDLQTTTLALDFRVTVLEENGGGDGNSSVSDLEVRVETLEGTADDHETRISATETDVNGNIFSKFSLYTALTFYC